MPISHSGQYANSSIGVEVRASWLPAINGEALLAAVADGDKSAFDAIYRSFAARVFGLARRVLRDAAQAEEIAQEVFIHIWSHASRFDVTKGSALSWIMVITHRKAIDRVRASQASRNRDSLDYANAFERDLDTVGDALESRAESQLLHDSLEALTTLQRESILLAYFSGLTYAEVGELLSIPLGTVKSRIRDGLIRLRDSLLIA